MSRVLPHAAEEGAQDGFPVLLGDGQDGAVVRGAADGEEGHSGGAQEIGDGGAVRLPCAERREARFDVDVVGRRGARGGRLRTGPGSRRGDGLP
ncbi:hypothetical protein V6574_29020 [Streptomyces sp. SM1P]